MGMRTRNRAERPKSASIPPMNQPSSQSIQWNGLSLAVFPEVYPPHEDSFLLAEAAEKYSSGRVLDLGCGSGIAGICAAKNKNVIELVLADISPDSLENAKSNLKRNKAFPCGCASKAKFVKSNLFSNLLGEKFDTILFNPPYLPTSREEKLAGRINSAFDGGKSGRKVIDRFLAQFPPHLNGGGVLLYLDSSLTDSKKTEKAFEKEGFTFKNISSQKFFFEELRVVKVTKKGA